MMNSHVSLSELRETVERMERRLRERNDSLSIQLLDVYDNLIPRFQSDLQDEREELLSQAAALMLIQQFLREKQQISPE